MKFVFSLVFALFIGGLASAQPPVQARPGAGPSVTGKVAGLVIDSLSGQPVGYATVAMAVEGATRNINGALTDDKGEFKMDNVAPGKYNVTVSFMGYKSRTLKVNTTARKPDENLGRIILAPSANVLKEVAVTGEVPMIENRVDKMVYNAEKDATISGGNAGDVLRKVPMLSVDQDGNVSLRGSQNVKILINGKPSGAVAASTADAMKMLPADQIKNVEVITSPSAKYDAEGTGGIINIITKRREMTGVSGSISGGVGTRQNNGNANLNVNRNRLGITANFGGNSSWPQTTATMSSSFTPQDQTSILQRGESTVSRYGYMASGNVSYDFNDFNSISSGIRFNQGRFKTEGHSTSSQTIAGVPDEEYFFDNNNNAKFGGFDWNADYTHKFKKQGHEFTLAGQWSHSKNTNDFTSMYSVADRQDRLGDNDAKNDEYTVQADYVLPLSKVLKLEMGGKAIFRDIHSESDFFTADDAGQFAFNQDLSNVYTYNQDVYSGYTVFSFQLPKSYGLQLGGRLENTQIEGDSQNARSGIAPVSNSYTNFIPSFALSKSFANFTNLRLSYSKRIQRPSLQFLNPFRDQSNDQFQRQGNPQLSPEITQTVEFAYSTMIKKSMINASVYFRHTDDIIESITRRETFEEQPVNLTTFDNIGENNSLGASLFASVNVADNITLRGNLDVYSYKPATSGSLSNLAGEDKTYAMYRGFISGSYNLPNNFVTETFMILNSPRRTFQGTSPSFSMWVVSFNKQFLNKKAKIGINIVDPFNENKHFKSDIRSASLVQQQDFSVPFRSVGLNFSYQFGKMNFNPQQQRKRRGVNNDDLKQDGGQGGQVGQGMGQ